MRFQKNVSLKNYTTFKIGGRAKYFFIAKTKEDLIGAIATAKKLRLPFFVLGGGSNVLVSDKGFRGLIIKFQNPNTEPSFMKVKVKKRTKSSSPSKIQIKSKFQNPKIYVEAGTSLGQLVNLALKNNLSGLEWAAGIPGTVGGAVFGNAGAFQKSMKNVVKEVEVFDAKELRIENYELRDCQFGYRDSVFKRNKNLIILSVVLKLKKGRKSEIKKKIKEYLNYKKETHPLNYPSAGSVFKNPSGFSAGELGEENKSSSSSIERGEAERRSRRDPSLRFAAARLIEKCGLKGKKIGQAQISEKHANFIVNLGNARAKDAKKLINLAKKEVKKKFKINLEEEIQFL